MPSVGTELPKEMARVRGLLPIYDGLPNNAGVFAATMMRADLDKAAIALSEGNIVEIIRVYESLKGYSA